MKTMPDFRIHAERRESARDTTLDDENASQHVTSQSRLLQWWRSVTSHQKLSLRTSVTASHVTC